MTRLDKIIIHGDAVAIRAELERQEAIYAEQLRKRWAPETKATARFAIAAHITKTERKLSRLAGALVSAERFERWSA